MHQHPATEWPSLQVPISCEWFTLVVGNLRPMQQCLHLTAKPKTSRALRVAVVLSVHLADSWDPSSDFCCRFWLPSERSASGNSSFHSWPQFLQLLWCCVHISLRNWSGRVLRVHRRFCIKQADPVHLVQWGGAGVVGVSGGDCVLVDRFNVLHTSTCACVECVLNRCGG